MPRDQITNVEEVSPACVAEWLDAGEVLLVDVRETHEYEAEHIAGALLLPLSGLDPTMFPALPGRRVVLHCAIGKRSQAAANMLLRAGHPHVVHMRGGLKAWKELGLDTELPLDEPQSTEFDRPAPCPGEVLAHDYVRARGMDGAALANDLGVAEDLIAQVLDGSRAMDAELSLRLARYFSTEPDFWMQVQLAHDLHRTRTRLSERIAREIRPRAA